MRDAIIRYVQDQDVVIETRKLEKMVASHYDYLRNKKNQSVETAAQLRVRHRRNERRHAVRQYQSRKKKLYSDSIHTEVASSYGAL